MFRIKKGKLTIRKKVVIGVCLVSFLLIAIALIINNKSILKHYDDEKQTQTSTEVERTEVKSERTLDTTTYKLSDGSNELVMYADNVRFINEDGDLVDYDASLRKIEGSEKTQNNKDLTGYSYTNTAGNMKNYIPTKLSQNTPMLMEYNKNNISFSPFQDDSNIFSNVENISEVSTIKENVTDLYDNVSEKTVKATYESSDKSIRFEYISYESGIKENIILNKKPESNILSFEIQVNTGVIPVVAEDKKTIIFNDKDTSKVIGYILSPNMDDASKQNYSENISYNISELSKNKYRLDVIIDSEYLNSKNTTYPITIDPQYTWLDSDNVFDAYVLNSSSNANTNYYTSDVTAFFAGYTPSNGKANTYIKFKI